MTRRESPWQLDLFEDAPRHRLETTIDALGERFGRGIVVPARHLRHPGTRKALCRQAPLVERVGLAGGVEFSETERNIVSFDVEAA